jgi:hypothetical protein
MNYLQHTRLQGGSRGLIFATVSSYSRISRFRVSARKSAILFEAVLAFLRIFMHITGQCFILGHDHFHPQTSQVIINQLNYAIQLDLLTAAYNKNVMIRIEQREIRNLHFIKMLSKDKLFLCVELRG